MTLSPDIVGYLLLAIYAVVQSAHNLSVHHWHHIFLVFDALQRPVASMNMRMYGWRTFVVSR